MTYAPRAPRPPRPPLSRGARGFTYIGVLFLVAGFGVALAAAAVLSQTQSKREREADLLFVGGEFQRALQSYSRAAQGLQRAPLRLEDLLRDPRFADTRRHLRRIYADPMTGAPDWGLVRDASGGIIAVHSQSKAAPMKRANFPAGFATFEKALSYADWRFGAPSAGSISPAGSQAARALAGPSGAAGAIVAGEPAARSVSDEADPRQQSCAVLLAEDLASCNDPQIRMRYGAAQVAQCLGSAQTRLQQCQAGNVPTQPLLYRPEFGR
jgi:type II secretory pathway pseudopilin PulG